MPTRQKDRYRTIEWNPRLGGNLITRGSADNAGVFNYVTKRNFQRDLDVEIRRPGADYFYPNINLPVGGQPFPGQLKVTSLTRSGATATATFSLGHHFENGETLIITGASNAAYNGAFVISNVGPVSFDYTVVGAPPTPDTGTAITAAPVETINLLGLARRPNGQTAVIAGSARRLYRYYALDDPLYISEDPSLYPTGLPLYWSEAPADYPPLTPADQLFYVDENPGYWIVIGYGFSTDGRRWEAEPINGYLCLNNGVDLPVTYRVEELSVVPIYELRENGIASVGTIANFNGFLMCMDITEIHADVLKSWFQTAGFLAVSSLTRSGSIVTGTISGGSPFRYGDQIFIEGATQPEYNGTFIVIGGTATTFQYIISSTPVTPAGGLIQVRLLNAAYQRYTDLGTIDRTTYRVVWGVADEPRRFAAEVPGTIVAGNNVLILQYPVLGFSVGQQILIVGAGASHSGGTADNLLANIVNISLTALAATLVLDTFALTTVHNTPVISADAEGSTAGFEDLQDDGSGILKALMLADQLIIYKETSVFLCQYTGVTAQPFAFQIRRIAIGTGLFYRNTLALSITPTEFYHVYAGRDMFYRWDLTNQQPMVLPKFESVSNIFFSQANLANTEKIFAFDNGEAAEICFCFPIMSGQDRALCWDYVWDTISTTDLEITAGATIRKPQTGLAIGAGEDWCILGNSQGAVLLYGQTDIPQTVKIASITRVGGIATATLQDGQPMFYGDTVLIAGAVNAAYNGTFSVIARVGNTFQYNVAGSPPTPDGGTNITAVMEGTELFYRRTSNPFNSTRLPYTWTLMSGLGHFGYRNGEKDVDQYLLQLASQCPDTGVTVTIYGTVNANAPTSLVAQKTFSDPEFVCNMPMMARQFYFQSSISGAGIDDPFELVGSIWRVAPVDSRSAGRTF